MLDVSERARKTARARALLAGLGLLASAAMPAPAMADGVTPQSVNGFAHFGDCFHVLITNGDMHAANCTPSGNQPTGASLTSFSGGAGPTGTIDLGSPEGPPSEDCGTPCEE
jgi:hypothetical protein